MDHIRKKLREAFKTRLTGLTTTGSNVFDSRVYPIDATRDLPGLVILNGKDVITTKNPSSKQPRIQQREMAIDVYGIAADPKNLDDVLDTIALEVEDAVQLDAKLGSLVLQTELESVEYFLTAEGNQPSGAVLMKFKCLVHTKEGDASKSAIR